MERSSASHKLDLQTTNMLLRFQPWITPVTPLKVDKFCVIRALKFKDAPCANFYRIKDWIDLQSGPQFCAATRLNIVLVDTDTEPF